MSKPAVSIKNNEETSGSQRSDRKASRKRSRSRSEQGKKPDEIEGHAATSASGKRKNSRKPLNGMVLSVSTFSDKNGEGDVSFNSVGDTCKAMGAVVTSQISKRVQLLICTPSAVKQATQRVRKAFKKNVPIVGIDWLEACKNEGENMPLEDFLLDEDVNDAIENRATNLNKEKSGEEPCDDALLKLKSEEEPGEGAGWSEPKALGCCCVCHENGSEKDCKWCVDCE
jgi:hypothetical protein